MAHALPATASSARACSTPQRCRATTEVSSPFEIEEEEEDALELDDQFELPPVVQEDVEKDEEATTAEVIEGDAPEGVQPDGGSMEAEHYGLGFLWLEKNIGICVDQVYKQGQRAPLTAYVFWPRKDAWEELKVILEEKPWVSERDKVLLLNKVTEVINYWQDEAGRPSMDQAQEKFPDCVFSGM